MIDVSYLPSHIIITGPCIGYTEHFLRERFPQSQIISIQYSDQFNKYNSKWDKSFLFTEGSDVNIVSDELFSLIGEEKLFSTLFLSWKPSEKAWPELASKLWTSFKDLLAKAESIISTRNYFNKPWFINTLNFFTSIQNICHPQLTDKPIIITASGPSLSSALLFLKKNRQSYILLSASSSILPLIENGIIPDYCISTDGGWWAKKHLEPLLRKGISIPLIVPPEAAVPKEILSFMPIIPMSYNDFPDNLFFKQTGIPFIAGERNGTVSGTAALLALSITSGKVFFCGLDLSSAKEYQHTQPNALELINSKNDCRIKTLETRCSAASLPGNKALTIYRNWFASRNDTFYNRVSRLVTKRDKLAKIPHMDDIFIDENPTDLFPVTSGSSSLVTNKIKIKKSKIAKDIYHLLKNVKDEIETNPEKTYNYDWYRMAALKDLIHEERSGKKTISPEIIKKTRVFLDEAISKIYKIGN